jgi:uncharacterized protein (DUF2267 family)
MSDFLMELASKTGISPEQAKKAVGALLAAIKPHIPAEQFTRLSQAVPGADDMMAAAAAEHSSGGGGILGAVADMAGKIFGGGGAMAAVVDKLGHLGLSADQVKTFVSHVVAFLRSKLPPDVMAKISHLLPAEEVPAS